MTAKLLTRDAPGGNAARLAPTQSGTAPVVPANESEVANVASALRNSFAELEQRLGSRFQALENRQMGLSLEQVRAELAPHAQAVAELQATLTRAARPRQGGGATAEAEREERLAAFGYWLRTGDNARLVALNARSGAAESGSAWRPEFATRASQGLAGHGPSGGYIILDNVSREIDRIRAVYSNLRQYASVQRISTGNTWSKRTRISGGTATRTPEQAARLRTDALQWAVNEITAHEAQCSPEYSRQSLADPFTNLETEVFQDIGEAYGLLNSIEHVSGSGVGEPQGFMSIAKAEQADPQVEVGYGVLGYVATGHATNWSATAGDEFDVFSNVRTLLKPEYLPNASYFMNRVSLGEIMLFKDANDLPIWQPSMQAGVPSQLRGYPVALIEHMAKREASSFPVSFGDMRQYYTILDRVGMDVLPDPYGTPGFTTFWTWMRDGAKVMKSEAMKAIKIEA